LLSTGAGLAVDGRGNLMVTEEVSVRMVAAKSLLIKGAGRVGRA
jgi:hypothetical protein